MRGGFASLVQTEAAPFWRSLVTNIPPAVEWTTLAYIRFGLAGSRHSQKTGCPKLCTGCQLAPWLAETITLPFASALFRGLSARRVLWYRSWMSEVAA